MTKEQRKLYMRAYRIKNKESQYQYTSGRWLIKKAAQEQLRVKRLNELEDLSIWHQIPIDKFRHYYINVNTGRIISTKTHNFKHINLVFGSAGNLITTLVSYDGNIRRKFFICMLMLLASGKLPCSRIINYGFHCKYIDGDIRNLKIENLKYKYIKNVGYERSNYLNRKFTDINELFK